MIKRSTCGKCFWADPPPPKSAIGQRTCRGRPPTAAIMRGGPTGDQFVTVFPGVHIDDLSCGAFVERPAIMNTVVQEDPAHVSDLASILEKVPESKLGR